MDASSQAPAIYDPEASSIQNLENIWDRMARRFKPEDFVRVMNIDDETFYWQALDPRDEHVEIEGNQFMQHKRTTREKPKMFSIPAGSTMVLEGWNASIMIEKLYKKVIAKKKIGNRPEGTKVMNFSWQSPQVQEDYIDKIFVGVERPEFNTKPTAAPKQEIKTEQSVSDLAKELGIDV